MTNEEKQAILDLCIVKGDFVLHSGAKSSWKLVVERITGDSLQQVYDAMNIKPDSWPIGIPTGGTYILDHVYIFDHVPLLYSSSAPVTLVDDVVTTGSSMELAKTLLEQAGIKVIDQVCILNRGDYPCRSLFTLADVEALV